MARVTGDEVKAIFNTTLTAVELDPFIIIANLVTNRLSDSGLSEEELKEIERWLSAHYAAMRDPLTTYDKIGEAEARYQGKTGMYLEATTYGQQALTLDYTGTLKALNAKKAQIKHIG